eukprot:2076354-Pleurochrysis_carterae.AAC.1
MPVPSPDQQSSLLSECAENHAPHVMLIDEISNAREAMGCASAKHRGIRLIAGAQGGLRTLLDKPELRSIVGGVNTSTAYGKPPRTVAQRAGAPVFDVIVELCAGTTGEAAENGIDGGNGGLGNGNGGGGGGGARALRVVRDSAAAVDAVLRGGSYAAELRTRQTATGALVLAATTN